MSRSAIAVGRRGRAPQLRNRKATIWLAVAVGLLLEAPHAAARVATAPAARPAPARLSLTPATAIAGERVMIRASLPTRVVRPAVLQRRTPGGWTRVASGRTSARGIITFALAAPATSTSYRVLARAATVRRVRLARVATPVRGLRVDAQRASLVAPAEVAVDATAIAQASFAPPRRGRAVSLERRVGGSWVAEGTGTEDASGKASFALDTSAAGTRTYRVVAATAGGARSVASPARTVRVSTPTTPPDTSPPDPVTGLTVGSATTSTLTLRWTNPSDADLAGVMVRRAVGSTPPASPSAGTLVVDAAVPGTSHVDEGLAPGTTYAYAAFAHDAVPNAAPAVTGTGTTVAASASDWAQARHDAQHTAWSPDETTISTGNARNAAEEWHLPGRGEPSIYAGVLYVSSAEPLAGKGRLTAYDLGTGTQLWQIDTGACHGPVSASATLVVVGCGEPRAYERTGAHGLVWDVHDTDPGATLQSFQLTADRLVAWSGTRVAAYRLSDGQRVWQQLLPSGATTIRDVVVSDATLVVAYDDRLRGLALATGAPIWVDSGVVSSSLVAAGGWIYTNHEGAVRRYAAADGAAGWTALPAGDIYRVLGADADTVYVWEAVFDFSAPTPSIIHALRQSDGAQRWQADVPSRVGAFAVTGDLVWFTSTGIFSQEHASDLVALGRASGQRLLERHFADNMYGADVAFGGGKVAFEQGGSAGDPVPAAVRVYGLAGPVPTIATPVVPIGRVGAAYSATLAAATAGVTWTVVGGTLPSGLALSANGAISGTPTAAGLRRITVRATGANGRVAERSYPLEVVAGTTWSWELAGRDASRNPFVPGSAAFGLDAAPSFAFRWKTAAPGATISGGDVDAVWAGDRAYAIQWDGTLSAWATTGSAANRAPLWSTSPAGVGVQFVGQPSLAGDRLIVRDSAGHVQGIRLTDGAHLWTTTGTVTSNDGFQPMLVSGGSFYTTGANDAYVAFSTADGSARWGGATTGVDGTYFTAATDGTRLYVQRGCEVYAFAVADGSTAWHTPVDTVTGDGCASVFSENGPPIVVDGRVYAVTPFGRMVADAVTGAPLVRIPSYNFGQGEGVVAGGLWIFDNDARTVAVDTATGQVAWSVPDNGDDIRYSVVGDLVIAVAPFSMVGLSRLTGEQVWDAGDVGSLGTRPTPVVGADRILLLSGQGLRAYGPLGA